jgi:hypothetical protein
VLPHWSHFAVEQEDDTLWRVTFDSPPINLETRRCSSSSRD